MIFRIEVKQEQDGRWIAEVLELKNEDNWRHAGSLRIGGVSQSRPAA
jgi:hypothetical protein